MKRAARFHRILELWCSESLPLEAPGGPLPAPQAHSSLCPYQMPAGHPQVRQRKQRDELRRVLCQTFVAHLGETELTLDNPKGMLDLGAHAGFELLDGFAVLAPGTVHLSLSLTLAWAQGHVPPHACGPRAFVNSLVAGIGIDFTLLPMQQAVTLGDIVDVGRCPNDRVYQSRIGINPDMGLHPEVPLVALLGLMHLGVSLAGAVLGGARCSNQGGVHHGSGLEHQALGSQGGVDGGQELHAEVVFFKEMTKPQDSALIRQSTHTGVQVGELAVQLDIVQRLFHGRIRQAKPLLKEVDAQHGGDCKRGSPRLATGRVRFNQRNQLCPRHHQIHLIEKFALTRSLGDQLETGRGTAFLFHR